jgi:hypothetical protein
MTNPLCTKGCGTDRGLSHPEVTEADKQHMMADLYTLGWGYHAIADLCGLSHDDMRGLLLADFPSYKHPGGKGYPRG